MECLSDLGPIVRLYSVLSGQYSRRLPEDSGLSYYTLLADCPRIPITYTINLILYRYICTPAIPPIDNWYRTRFIWQ